MTDAEWISIGCHPGGRTMLRVHVLRWIAKALRIQFKIGGQPWGASYERAVNHAPRRRGEGFTAVRAGKLSA